MKRNKYSIVLLLLITISSYSQNNIFSVLNIPENLRKNANSIVQKDESLVTMDSQTSYTLKSQQIVTVLNKLGDDNALIALYYDKSRQIKNVVVYIYDAFGNEIKKIKRKDFKDVSAYDGFSLYNDGRYLYYKYIPLSYPYTIHSIIEIKSENTAGIPSWRAIDGYNQSVQLSKFTFRYPLDVKLNKKEYNFNGFDVKSNAINGEISYEVKNIPAIKKEPYAPSFRKIIPYVRLSVNKFNLEGVKGIANNWKEFGKWYYDNLIQGTQALPVATKEKIKNLTSGTNDTIEKAKIIYNYVQNKVRYISVQVGIGGYKPMLSSDVDRLGYGDCKALTNYTSALLNVVGIKAYPTLIYAGEEEKRSIDAQVASPQGNHMILNLPINNKNIWLECTSQKVPFGEIASFTDDRDALVLTPNGGEVKHTRVYTAEDNMQQTNGNMIIDDKGNLKAQLTIKSTGTQYDYHLGKYDGETPKELDVSLKKYFSNINNIHLSKAEVANKKKEAIYKEDIAFEASDYASFTDSQMLIKINAFNRRSTVPKRIRNRKLPFEITNGYKDVDSINVQLPKALKVNYIPEKVELKNKFGEYVMELKKIDETHYLYVRKLKILGGLFPKEMYDSYRKFIKQIRKYDNTKIILTK
ncbi:MAG: DUF3857 domain-containing transglutaminase family protein [Lutibacter sp.]|uniref:DUF3857 domain-containing transglutaminase family protein n=1 Tax=Lutibacter sp. TaxID=1925666 RepID=UPI00299DAE76|nr:DUF3857 domain-containing transglutaminase family protein [Lutibacter sp.]MDX1828808.1 DUF3857 domain-containing transglutaminase family protein [Lutibacter sp.]